jgi:hypothetical protein
VTTRSGVHAEIEIALVTSAAITSIERVAARVVRPPIIIASFMFVRRNRQLAADRRDALAPVTSHLMPKAYTAHSSLALPLSVRWLGRFGARWASGDTAPAAIVRSL